MRIPITQNKVTSLTLHQIETTRQIEKIERIRQQIRRTENGKEGFKQSASRYNARVTVHGDSIHG